MLVKDIRPGEQGSYIEEFTLLSDALFFQAKDDVDTRISAWWKSDGTPEGTVRSAVSFGGFRTRVDNTLFFTRSEGESEISLWKSDGTPEGTAMLAELGQGMTDTFTIEVVFQPKSLGASTGMLIVECNDHDEPAILIPIEGTGVAPTIVDAGENISLSSEETASASIIGTASDEDDILDYRWMEGDTILLGWTPVAENGDCPLDLGSASLPLGQHTLTLEITNGETTVSDSMILTIDNSAPNASPTGAGSYPIGVSIAVAGQVSDFDGDTLTCVWSEGETQYCNDEIQSIEGGTPVDLPECELPILGLGFHTITLTVSNGINPPVANDISVEVVDTTAPTLAPEPNIGILWPPNHRMVDIVIHANAADNSGLPPELSVIIVSNESQESADDEDATPDWTSPVVDSDTGEISCQLRAERSGSGEGRIYTIIITATDDAGNESTAELEILVPHDKRKK